MKTKTEGQNCICVKPQIHKTYEDDVQQGSSEVETGKESCDQLFQHDEHKTTLALFQTK